MKRSNLCDYSDAYLYVQGRNYNSPKHWTAAAPNIRKKKVMFKNCAPFINCISEINNTQVDDAHGIHVVTPIYNLKMKDETFIDETVLNNKDVIIHFSADNNITSFKFKDKNNRANRK